MVAVRAAVSFSETEEERASTSRYIALALCCRHFQVSPVCCVSAVGSYGREDGAVVQLVLTTVGIELG